MSNSEVKFANNNSKLLVVIPHFNDSENLGRALASIKHYLVRIDYEVVVVDDCSKKEHLEKIKKYQENHGVKIIFNSHNCGAAYCRNAGIIWGVKNLIPYIIFVDSDDHLCDYVVDSDYCNSQITIFNHYETIGSYSCHEKFKNHINRSVSNSDDFISILESVKKYSVRPNRVPMLTTCWAKIYCINPIIKYKNYFIQEMRTFEDVQFLISLLTKVEHVKLVNKYIYVYAKGSPGAGATFGRGNYYNSLFSFLIVTRAVSNYYKLKLPGELFNKDHFNACYYSISLIRLALKVEFGKLFYFYKFICRRMRSRLFRSSFVNYDVKGRMAMA